MGIDLLDISHHNPISNWADVPEIPIVHKVNEGTAVDRRVRERLPVIADRTTLFGGYTVLIVSQSTIRQQIEQYAEVIAPYWRDGAFTQLDIEPWESYSRPVSADEIVEAGEHHDRLFGPGRFLAYINPNQLPGQYAELDRSGWLNGRLWLPNYSRNGHDQAVARNAVIHQYTSTASVSGFPFGIDANRVLDWDRVNEVANLTAPEPIEPPPTTPEEPDMTVKTLWSSSPAEDAPVYCIEDGCHISGAVRRAWKADPNVHVIEVYGDATGSDGLLDSMEHQSGKNDITQLRVPAHTIKVS